MEYILRITGDQHAALQNYLYPGDELEAGALLLCGRRSGEHRHILTAMKAVPIPLDVCERGALRLTWPTSATLSVIEEAARRSLAIVKVHSHPGGHPQFSEYDDLSDRSFLSSVHNWLDDRLPHASAVMLPGGRMFGRVFTYDNVFRPFHLIGVCGADLQFWFSQRDLDLPAFVLRQMQAFGKGTTEQLRRLSIAVIGTSGTGSPLIAELVRSGVGRVVLIDPDFIEEKNLNRIAFATMADVGRPKVEVLRDAILRIGMGTEVLAIHGELEDPDTIQTVAECDLAFGCMDSVSGRDLLNRLSTFYNLPYFDLGVALRASKSGIDQVAAALHYVQPGRSSLRSRKIYNSEDVRAELMKKHSPREYQQQLKEKYIRGVQEDRPAVMPVNALISSAAVHELFARIQPYRNDPNDAYAAQYFVLHEGCLLRKSEDDFEPCPVLGPHVGRGDVVPLLGRPDLSFIEGAA